MSADPWEKAKAKAGFAERDADIALLHTLLDDSELRPDEREAFSTMLDELVGPQGFPCLTPSRRRWAREVAARVRPGAYENLVSSGRVPRGREVPTPAVLQHLPKKPPGRT